MEAIFLHFIVEAVKGIVNGIDGLFEKSLPRAIPDLDQLLHDPQKALDHRAIVIGPRRKYCSATLVGLILALAGVGAFVLIFSIIQDRPGQKKFSPIFWWGTLGPIGLCSFVYGFRIFRGGYCIFDQEGVEFRYRKRVVRCSWPVFHSWGQRVFIKESNLLLLPISPAATDSIMEMNKEETEAKRTGLEVRTPQWETHTPVEAALKPLYVVKIQDLGDLLLQLGRKLGAEQTVADGVAFRIDWDEPTKMGSKLQADGHCGQSAEGQRATAPILQADSQFFPVAFREKNGWIRLSLTSFYLPYYCCICTVPTRNTFLFQLRNQGEPPHYPIHLPTCDQCRDKAKRRKRKLNLFLVGLPLASVLPLIVFFDNARPVLSVLLMTMPIFGLAAMWVISQRLLLRPAKVRYSPKKGSLHIRFQNREYENMVLAQRVRKQ